MAPARDTLLLKLGAAQSQSPQAGRLVDIKVDDDGTLHYTLRKDKLRQLRRREGRYLLRSNLPAEDPAQIWQLYMLLTQVEEAFKNLKGDLAVRPIFHQLAERIEAHIFVAFLAFCVHATLRHKLRLKAPGLTPRSVLEQLSAIQMLDVHFPTTDGRTLIFNRYTAPNKSKSSCLPNSNWNCRPKALHTSPLNTIWSHPPQTPCSEDLSIETRRSQRAMLLFSSQ